MGLTALCKKKHARPKATPSVALCNQVWQLGGVGGDAASFILGEHLRHVSAVRIFVWINIRERLAVGVADLKATGYCLDCPRWGKTSYRQHDDSLTVAWRSVLLPARCFTSTVSFGWHHLTSVSRDNLTAAHDVARRSSSAENRVRSSPASGGRRLLIQNKRGGPSVMLGIIRKASRDAAYYATLARTHAERAGSPGGQASTH